ncbi:MAG: flagellar basal body protein FliL [Micavibrio sp.]|nr:flagellar basal body protein FliL [Micavibrio sp.]|tara:strand:+ start:687664 stop:688218 length:555 start_codon:yes stop_codon:yes gene_type:complete
MVDNPNLNAPGAPQQENTSAPSLDENEGKSKKGLILVIFLIMLSAIGAGLYFSGLLDSVLGIESETTETTPEETAKAKRDASDATVTFLPIPDMIVNLSSPDGKPRYLRLSVQLELNSEEDVVAVQAILPRVIDQFQTYLRELRISDLRGSKGIYRLQTELLARVNAASPVEVRDVLFQEILIQ